MLTTYIFVFSTDMYSSHKKLLTKLSETLTENNNNFICQF